MKIIKPITEANGHIPEFTLCDCGRVSKEHCNSFVEKLWIGCKKVVSVDDEETS